MTAAWKADVRAALELRGASEQWLADQVSARRKRQVKRDAINKLLRKQTHSALVPDICAILGLAPPMIATPQITDDESQRLLTLVRKLPPEQRRAWISLLEKGSGGG